MVPLPSPTFPVAAAPVGRGLTLPDAPRGEAR